MKQKKSRKGYKRKSFRTPMGENRLRYERRKPSKAHCARCGGILSSIPRDIPIRIRKMTRSQRTVAREFGGVLCGRCVKSLETYRTRMEDGFVARRDLTIEKFLPTGWYKETSKKAAEKPVAGVKEEEPKKKKAAKKAGGEKPEKKEAKKEKKKAARTKTEKTKSKKKK
jgi:large subunit ribosomal protein L34e